MSAPLSFEQTPPFPVPLRFFLTGPLFGVAAGVVVAWQPELVTGARFALPTLAALHLLTAGFMLQVMAGALLQFLPVAAGANVWRPRVTGAVAHLGLGLGAAALVAGFLGAGGVAFRAAAALLGATVTAYVGVVTAGLWRSPAIGPTRPTLLFAVLGLLATVGLGVTLLLALAWSVGVPVLEVLHAHAAWGVMGWGVMLVAGVAYLVVPMFQLTPAYPTRFAFALPAALLASVLAWTGGVLFGRGWLEWVGTALGAGALAAFAGVTLWLQAKRRRAVTDATLLAWRLGMAALLVACVAGVALRVLPEGPWRVRLEYLVGAAVFAGLFPAVINGMLYKIVPFLVWLHLQKVMKAPPTMQKVIPAAHARWQGRVFAAALACLVGATAWSPLAVVGGVLFSAACALLEWHLVQAARLYRRLSAPAA